jgi:hypothetical protein
MRQIPWVRSWRLDFGRAAAGGLGSVTALSLTGWPDDPAVAAWIGLAGLLVGLAVSFGMEQIVRLHIEVGRLQGVKRDLQIERTRRAEEQRLYERQLVIAKREAAINAVDVEVWGGAYNEAQATGQFLPVDAILARREVLIKAKNLDVPLPPV